jgi:hypothetical protein
VITHKLSSIAISFIAALRHQAFEVCETSKVYDERGFGEIWAITSR